MIVGDDELDAMQTTGFQPQQKIPPVRSALPVGELNRQHLAPAVPVDADRKQLESVLYGLIRSGCL